MLRTFVAVAALFVCGVAFADTWEPPTQETYTSPDGLTRVVVTPRSLKDQLAYFSDSVDNKNKPGQSAHGPAQASAEVQRRDGDVWRPLRSFPLVNDVAPVDVVISNDGRVATLDNWHSLGWGDDVVVVYGVDGKPIRALGLEDVVPKAWRLQLSQSISSIWWRTGDPTIDTDANAMIVMVAAPASNDATTAVPVRISLQDGSVSHDAATWDPAMEVATKLEAERTERWLALREARTKPLLPPTGNDEKTWVAYAIEVHDRIAPEEGWWARMPYLPDAKGNDYTKRDVASLVDDLVGSGMDGLVLVSPDTRALAKLMARRLLEPRDGKLAGKTLVLLGTAEDRALIERGAKRTGLTLRMIDPAEPLPGKLEPEAAPNEFR